MTRRGLLRRLAGCAGVGSACAAYPASLWGGPVAKPRLDTLPHQDTGDFRYSTPTIPLAGLAYIFCPACGHFWATIGHIARVQFFCKDCKQEVVASVDEIVWDEFKEVR